VGIKLNEEKIEKQKKLGWDPNEYKQKLGGMKRKSRGKKRKNKK
jgi:hypothetical protein